MHWNLWSKKFVVLQQRDRSSRLPSRFGPKFRNLKITSKILILRLYLHIGPKVKPSPEPGGKAPDPVLKSPSQNGEGSPPPGRSETNLKSNPNESDRLESKERSIDLNMNLEARFANSDGVGMLMERLHPEALQWLYHHFHCKRGCQGGISFLTCAPIFDARIDLWWRSMLKKCDHPLTARMQMAATLFVTGLSIPVLQVEEGGQWTVQDLEDYLFSYNHFNSWGRECELDPEGLGTRWPHHFLNTLQTVCPSIHLTLHAIRRMVEHPPTDNSLHGYGNMGKAASQVTDLFSDDDPNISEIFELPASMRMYLYAGAIAGGIIPGTLSHPYPDDHSTCHKHDSHTE